MRSRKLRRRRHRRLAPLLTLALAATALLIIIATRTATETGTGRSEEAVSATGTQAPAPITEHASQRRTPTVDSSAAEKQPEWEPDETEAAYIAKTIFGEAGVVSSKARKAAVGWCILNRVDAPGFGDTVEEVVTAPSQFHGYDPDIEPPESYYELARDILTRHHREQQGETNTGRTLPQDYCYFWGDGSENHFTQEWHGKDYWNWSLPNPYDT